MVREAQPALDQKESAAPPLAAASVIALVLREFSQQPVAEQARLKSQLEALLAIALQAVSPADRIVLDAPEGLVVVFLGGPEQAIDVAERAQAGAADLPLCSTVNHGVVKSLPNPGGSPRLVGDGILSALTLANLATRGRLLVSRTFRDALASVAPHRAGRMMPVGALTDATLRTHELFTPDSDAMASARRRLVIGGGVVVFATLGAGIGGRIIRTAAAQPGVVHFDIKPKGDIYVDGEFRGTSPPLTQLAVSPGAHTIEVRSNPHPPLRLEVRLKPAEEMKVSHAFAGKGRKEGDSLFERIFGRK